MRHLVARSRLRGRRFAAAPSVQEVLQAADEESREEKPRVSAARGVLWVANVYPTKAFRFDVRHLLTHHNHEPLATCLVGPLSDVRCCRWVFRAL